MTPRTADEIWITLCYGDIGPKLTRDCPLRYVAPGAGETSAAPSSDAESATKEGEGT
jgi:hypothetical protein